VKGDGTWSGDVRSADGPRLVPLTAKLMDDCIFCKIGSGELPSTKLYEDDRFLAFLDIQPVSLGHALVIPKEHYQDISQVPEGLLGGLFGLARCLGDETIAETGAAGFNIVVNRGVAAGQVVMHAHVHVIPREPDDGLKHWPKKDIPEEDRERLAAALRDRLG